MKGQGEKQNERTGREGKAVSPLPPVLKKKECLRWQETEREREPLDDMRVEDRDRRRRGRVVQEWAATVGPGPGSFAAKLPRSVVHRHAHTKGALLGVKRKIKNRVGISKVKIKANPHGSRFNLDLLPLWLFPAGMR